MKNFRGKINLACTGMLLAIAACTEPAVESTNTALPTTTSDRVGNPIITHKYTADPAALVYNDTVFLYVGHDEAPARKEFYETY